MRVYLIHGGVWDGWWIMESKTDGRRRIVRDLLDCEFVAIRATCPLEEVTPGGEGGGRMIHPPKALRARAEALGLKVLTTEA